MSQANRRLFCFCGSIVVWGGIMFMLTSTETAGRKFQTFCSITHSDRDETQRAQLNGVRIAYWHNDGIKPGGQAMQRECSNQR